MTPLSLRIFRARDQKGTRDENAELDERRESIRQKMRAQRTMDTRVGPYTPDCSRKQMLLGGAERCQSKIQRQRVLLTKV